MTDQPTVTLRGIALPAYGPTALASIGTGAVLPVLALTARDLGASVGLAALVVGLIGVGQFVCALPAGSLVARIGERRALVLASVTEAASLVAAMVSTAVWQLGAAVLVLGASQAVFGLARQAYLTDAVPLRMRARALSTLGGIFRIGLFVGPLIGAFTVSQWGLRSSYAVAAIAALGAGLVVLLTRDLTAGTEQARLRRSGTPLPVWTVLREHRHVLLTLGTGVLIVGAVRACRTSVLPLWAEAIGLDGAQTSLVFAVAGAVEMVLFYPAGSVMDRFGRTWVAVPTVVVMGIGLLVLPLTSTMTGLTVVAILMAVGNGMSSGIIMTLGADASPLGARAQFLAGWRLFADFGATAGPLAISAITALIGLSVACIAMGALSLVGGGWLARWVPRFDPRRSAEP